jgi:hypothetical protein
MQFKEEEVVTKKSTIDVQSGEVHKVFEKDNTVSVVFQEEKNDVLIKCVLNLTKDQLAHINREHNIKPLAKEQLQAIHAKNDEAKEAALATVTEPIVELTIPAKLNGPIKHLPTEAYPPLNWKDKTPEREAKLYRSKIDPDRITMLLEYVFRWHKRNKYHKSRKDKSCNLAHFLKTYLPKNNNMDFQTCRRIYLAQTYKEVTAGYRQQWVDLVRDLDNTGYHNEVPDYIRKHYIS